MATKEQVRAMTTAQPFRPFAIKLASGGSFEVRHPENVACSLNGEEMTVYDEQGMHLVDMMLVEVLEPVPSAGPKPKAKGNRK
jgi:hypothetical protein